MLGISIQPMRSDNFLFSFVSYTLTCFLFFLNFPISTTFVTILSFPLFLLIFPSSYIRIHPPLLFCHSPRPFNQRRRRRLLFFLFPQNTHQTLGLHRALAINILRAHVLRRCQFGLVLFGPVVCHHILLHHYMA